MRPIQVKLLFGGSDIVPLPWSPFCCSEIMLNISSAEYGFETSQMCACNLVCIRKFTEKCVNRCHMKGWNQLLQLRKQDCDHSGDGLFQLGSLTKFIMIMGKFMLNVMKRDFGDFVRECGDLPF